MLSVKTSRNHWRSHWITEEGARAPLVPPAGPLTYTNTTCIRELKVSSSAGPKSAELLRFQRQTSKIFWGNALKPFLDRAIQHLSLQALHPKTLRSQTPGFPFDHKTRTIAYDSRGNCNCGQSIENKSTSVGTAHTLCLKKFPPLNSL